MTEKKYYCKAIEACLKLAQECSDEGLKDRYIGEALEIEWDIGDRDKVMEVWAIVAQKAEKDDDLYLAKECYKGAEEARKRDFDTPKDAGDDGGFCLDTVSG